ncbi:metallophosphoesterase family protein [Gordonia neofelifaecis]|uniref:Nuclease SbcCD subunit D n=1 Tax=Gordonia neofelifaecis NRRL B-59395 TaxID=644548 RepID=F1YFN7_9ACTN|nr:metallophosphoesterase [Gordonia neofelifaecis]EGD56669.1 DNA repair exonuclease [Gordonia neofelifaecis NRRL B-59395]
MSRPAYDDSALDSTTCVTEPLFDLEPLALFSVPSHPIETTRASAPGPAPALGRTVTFLHTADWQLGMTRHFLAGEAQSTYNAAREDAIVRIGEVARSTGAEFVVVCGDVFDDPRVSTRIIRRTLDALGDYPVPVYLLPGNHDPLDATSVYRSREFVAACPDNVTVLDKPGVVAVREGISLVAAPWTTKRPLVDLVNDQIAQLAASDDIRIVVGHGGVDSLSPNDDPSIVGGATLDVAIAAELVDYVALGDRHSVTSVGDSGRVWYSGAPEVTAFDHVETEPGHVLEVRLSREGERSVDVTRHRVGQWAFRTLRDDINGADDIVRLREQLSSIPDKSRTVVQLSLTGTIGVADDVALSGLLDEFGDRFAALKIWERHHDLTVVSDPSDVDALDLQGYAALAAAELAERAASDDGNDADAARSALGLLHRLIGAGR